MDEKRVLNELAVRCPDKRLSCESAFEIAQRLGVEPIAVGRAANHLGIKIVDCQLGCFGCGSRSKG